MKKVLLTKVLLTIASITVISFGALAQDKDTADIQKGNSEINRNKQTELKRPTAEDQRNRSQDSNSNASQTSGDSSSTNQSLSVPAGDNGILDGTNAIPVDSSKKSGKHLNTKKNNRPKKKNEK